MIKLNDASEFEIQVHEDIELGRHILTETALREIEIRMSQELNRDYRIPEAERQRLKLRNNYL